MTEFSELGIVSLPSLDDTTDTALRLMPCLKPGDLIALVGPLGAGKTAFAREILRSLAGNRNLEGASPTFSLVHHYDENDGLPFPVAHADLYRLEEGSGIDDLALDEVLDTGILLVEWPDRLPASFLETALVCRFQLDKGSRHLHFLGNADWQKRLLPFFDRAQAI